MKPYLIRIPKEYDEKIEKFSKLFCVPKTKAFLIREKILLGDFEAKKMNKRKDKSNVWEVKLKF